MIGGILIVLTLLGCGMTVWSLHRQTIEQNRVAVRNLGFVLAEQTSRYVQVVDRVLEEIQSRAAALNISNTDELTRAFDTDSIRALLRERLKNLPQANAFFVVRADGTPLASSRLHVPADLQLQDRDYYRHFVENDDPHPFISEPMNSRVVDRPAMYIARRINGPHREFLGVAGGAIDLQYLDDFYRAIELPDGESVTLLRHDGLVLARYPDPQHIVGSRMPAVSVWYKLIETGGGTYRSPGFLAPAPAVVSVHPLPGWP